MASHRDNLFASRLQIRFSPPFDNLHIVNCGALSSPLRLLIGPFDDVLIRESRRHVVVNLS